jgi:hypothetical protein
MNESNFGRRISQAIQEKDWRKILRLMSLGVRVAKREYPPPGWTMTVFLTASYAVFMVLAIFAGEAWAWTAFGALAAYWLFVRIPRRARHALEVNRNRLNPNRSRSELIER